MVSLVKDRTVHQVPIKCLVSQLHDSDIALMPIAPEGHEVQISTKQLALFIHKRAMRNKALEVQMGVRVRVMFRVRHGICSFKCMLTLH